MEAVAEAERCVRRFVKRMRTSNGSAIFAYFLDTVLERVVGRSTPGITASVQTGSEHDPRVVCS